jgi:hypothetical protein
VVSRSKYVGSRKNQADWTIDGRKSMGGKPSLPGHTTSSLLGLRLLQVCFQGPQKS